VFAMLAVLTSKWV